MKKFKALFCSLKLWLILFVTVPLSGCFEFIHEMNVNSNGTGHFNVVLNFSRSESKIDMILLLSEVNGHKIPSIQEINKKFTDFLDTAKASKGITNVVGNFDKDKYIMEFGCDFDKVDRINQRLYDVWQEIDCTEAVYEKYYSFENQQFSQNLSSRIVRMFKKMSPADREILIGADYTSILRFDQEVISQSNKIAKVIPSKKVIIVQSTVLKLLQEPYLFNNIVKIKK